MNKEQYKYLENYMEENKVEDTTKKIREEKQSQTLKDDMKVLFKLKRKHKSKEEFKQECDKRCKYLKEKQSKLYDKLVEDDTSKTVNIAYKMIEILEKIERGRLNQNEGAFEFGTLCKEIFVDPELNNNNSNNNKAENTEEVCEISWEEYKKKYQ